MKQRGIGTVILLVFLTLSTLRALDTNSIKGLKGTINPDPIFYGVWDCKVVGAAPEYQYSTLFITKQEDGLPSVIVQLDRASLTGQDVGLGEKDLRFDINLEGVERVSFVLEADVDQLIGKVFTSGESLPVTCSRKSPSK